MSSLNADAVNAAIPLYLGVGVSTYPKADATRLTPHFGDGANELAEEIEALLADLDAIEPDWDAHTLASGSAWAVEQLRSARSDLSDEAAAALVWAYSFWRR